MLTIHVTPADDQDREQVEALVATVREVPDETVELAFSNQGSTGDRRAVDAPAYGIRLEVRKLLEANHGFVWEPRRWVVGVLLCLGGVLSAAGQGLCAVS